MSIPLPPGTTVHVLKPGLSIPVTAEDLRALATWERIEGLVVHHYRQIGDRMVRLDPLPDPYAGVREVAARALGQEATRG